jgi:hypothetical protein
MSPDLMQDDFQYCRDFGDSELWQIPHDVSLNTYATWAQRLPNTPNCDGLLMMRNCCGPIRDWNLSRWICRGLCKLDNCAKTERFYLQVVPDSIPLPSVIDSPILAVLKGEVEEFNEVLENARKQGNLKNIYLAYLNEKQEYLLNCVRQKKLGVVRCKFFSNLRGLLFAFLSENLEGLQLDQAGLEFALLTEGDQDMEVGNGCLVLRGLNLICAGLDDGQLVINRRRRTIEPFPDLLVTVVRVASRLGLRFMCPMFRTLVTGKQKGEYLDGRPVNFVWHVPVKTEHTQIELVANGSCLVCELPEAFEQHT